MDEMTYRVKKRGTECQQGNGWETGVTPESRGEGQTDIQNLVSISQEERILEKRKGDEGRRGGKKQGKGRGTEARMGLGRHQMKVTYTIQTGCYSQQKEKKSLGRRRSFAEGQCREH